MSDILSTLSLLQFPFWLAVLATCFFGYKAWQLRETSVGIPMLAVLFTMAFWYFGDVLYNGYLDYCAEFPGDILDEAWWEVLLFVVAFGIMTPMIHRQINRKFLGRSSYVLHFIRHGGIKSPKLQKQVDVICLILLVPWLILMVIALFRTDFDFQGLFAPYLGEKADPWARNRIGVGYDSLLAAAGYTQTGLAAAFGIVAAVVIRPRTLMIALLICVLTLPGYIFDRTRSAMLAAMLPGFFALVFLRIRVPLIVRVLILALGFIVTNYWMMFVIENRSALSISDAFRAHLDNKATNIMADKHLGLNMFEELGFENAFIEQGSYRPNWGECYFSELVNPIPRSLWPGKPLVGIDYAIARGQTYNEAGDTDAGVGSTVSTGLIGQGVVNFGQILGPMAAALLMSLWVSILARQDLLGKETGRLLLYAIGLVLTFSMGRDITLLVIYPFCFGYLFLLILNALYPVLKPPPSPPSEKDEEHPVLRLRLAKVSPDSRH